jgi:hypothetical protein
VGLNSRVTGLKLHTLPPSLSTFILWWPKVSPFCPLWVFCGQPWQDPHAQFLCSSTQLVNVLLHSRNSNQITMNKVCCVGGSYTCIWTLEKRKKILRNVPPTVFCSADLQVWPRENKTSITFSLNGLESCVSEKGALWELFLPQHLHLGISCVLFQNPWRTELFRKCFLQDLVNVRVTRIVKQRANMHA